MQNQRAVFTCGIEDVTMVVTLHANKKGDIKVEARQKSWDGKKMHETRGCTDWFEKAEEEKAKAAFSKLVDDAKAKGWSLKSNGGGGGSRGGFSAIPEPPKSKPAPAAASRK